jgi:hypothetical protein
MTKDDAERCYLAYTKISTRSNPTPYMFQLSFIVTTLENTDETYGASGSMREHLHEPLELETMLINSACPYSFVLKIYNGHHRREYDYNRFYYDYRDIIIEERTKGIIDLILLKDTPKKTTASNMQIFKFDEKNIYNFEKERKI